MEIKDSKNGKKNNSCSEKEPRDDSRPEAPTTSSRADTIKPEHESHNMNDLRTLDFNSADEIRQAMKAVMSGKTPPNHYEDCALQTKDKRLLLTSPNKSNQNIAANTRKELNSPGDSVKISAPKSDRKRRGRPSKAGPSRKIRRMNVTDMYLGKLSNVVPFKNKKGKYEYESDSDTLYIFC